MNKKLMITNYCSYTKNYKHTLCLYNLILQKYSQNVIALNNNAAVLATTAHHNETISCYVWILKMDPKNANPLVC
jgi:hypothetical protein